jgi:PBSX family phage terminase large subunit
MKFDLVVTPIFRRLQEYTNDTTIRYIGLRGGTSSGKSIAILQWLVLYCFENPNKTVNIITESMVKAKRGLIPDIRNIVFKELIQHVQFNKSESYFTFPNKTILRFISAEDPMKVVGLRSDILYADEVDGVDSEVINQLSIRTRDKILMSWNPRAKWEWYEEISQKKDYIEDVSTYLDNPFLEQAIIDDLLYKASKSLLFKQIYVDGDWGSLEGLVFTEDSNWFLIDQLPEIFDKEFFTLDFGFRHMTGIVKARTIKNDIYIQEYLYKNDMVTPVLAKEIWALNPQNLPIICDSEDQQQIATLKRIHGINAKSMKKLLVLDSIANAQSRNIFITKDSVNLIKELRNYHYSKKKTDKKNRPIPEKVLDDLVDPMRYAIDWAFKPKSNKKGKVIRI